MTTETPQRDIADMSFEEALAELEAIVRGLESGETKLEEAVTAYERGSSLKEHCEAKLRDAQLRVEQISVKADGEVTAEPIKLD